MTYHKLEQAEVTLFSTQYSGSSNHVRLDNVFSKIQGIEYKSEFVLDDFGRLVTTCYGRKHSYRSLATE